MAREMKDSGIEWIGKIPQEWDVVRIKNLADNHQENSFIDGDWIESPDISDEGIRYLTTGNVGDGQYKKQGNGFITVDTFNRLNCKYAYPGDLVIARLNAPYGRACILPNDYTEYVLAVDIVILRTQMDKRFLCYQTQCAGYQRAVEDDAKGTTMKRISRTNLGKIPLVIAPLDIQQRIADFLDRKCAEIDSVIAETQKTIEEYKALKQSIITEAVTKGVRGKRPMKDSGIEWIGEIPEEWYCTVLKRFCKFQTGGTPSTANQDWFDGDVDWFTPGDFSDNYLLSNSSRKLSEKAITDKAAVVIPENTVLIIGIGGTAGKIGITTQMCSCNQQITALLQDEHIFSRYLMYWMIANTKFLKETALFTTLPIINNQTIGEYVIVLPNTIEEQQEIAAFLDSKCAAIDALIAAKQQLLTELDSYKKSVIYEYVTGKKEVM